MRIRVLDMRKVLAFVIVVLVFSALPQGQAAPLPLAAIKAQIKTAMTPPASPSEQLPAQLMTPRSRSFGVPGAGVNRQVSKNQTPADSLRTGASETTIAGTVSGIRLIAGWNDGEGFGFKPFQPVDPPLGLSGYGVSFDGGRTWSDEGAPPMGSLIAFGPGPMGRSATGRYITRGDPWLDTAGPGRSLVYYANLAIWEDDPVLPPAGVSVHFGRFLDQRFMWTGAELIQSPNYPDDFVDKEAMVVTNQAIYVTLTNFIEVCNIPFFGFGQIELYRRTAAGWARRIIQPDESFITDPANPDCGLDGIIDQGSAPAVGPRGELYVVWERGWFAPLAGGAVLPRATIAFRRSTDGGDTWGPRVQVASICSGALTPPAAYNRTSNNDFPRIAVAHEGQFRGRVYVVYQDCSAASGAAPFGTDVDVYLKYSDDGGMTWSAPMALHPTADGKQQFWPVVSVEATGAVNVAYYEMRDVNLTPDPSDIECSVRIGGPLDNPVLRQSTRTTFSDVFHVRSTNGGMTWSVPARVTEHTTNWCMATPLNSIIPNFGDYIDMRSYGRRSHPVWADGRNANFLDLIPTVWYAFVR